MQWRVNDPERFRFANHLRIENQCFEPPHVNLIDVLPDHRHFSLSIFWKRCERFGHDGIHFGNHPAGVRLDHLRSVAEVNFVAIIVRWIVARRNHDAGVCFEITDSKRKLWHGARPVEHARVATVFSCDFRRNFGELFREKTRIMRDHDLRLRRNFLPFVPIVQVSDKSSCCAVDVKKIHRVRADAWEFRSLVLARISALRSRNDFPDRAATQTACSERKRLVETIV